MAIKEKTGGFMNEFKTFIARGNVVDMAVGVIIGGAFGNISKSLVNDVVMPAVSMLTGGLNFESWKLVLKEAVLDAEGAVVTAEVAMNFGLFVSTIVDFLITAFCIFVVLRILMKAKDKMEARQKAEEAEKAAAEAAAKAEADAAAAAAAAEAKAAEEAQKAEFKASIMRQETLLEELVTIMKNK
jgi:large conductance mechanosensitive channel